MTEYKINNATVRIHGTPDMENIKKATERFVKKAMMAKRKGEKK